MRALKQLTIYSVYVYDANLAALAVCFSLKSECHPCLSKHLYVAAPTCAGLFRSFYGRIYGKFPASTTVYTL